MDTWKGIGAFIARNLVKIVPCCLVLGILFPDAFSWMRPAVPTMFAFMTFQGSLGNSLKNLRAVVSHPLPIVLILTFSHIVVPIVGWLVGRAVFGADPDIVCGIVLEYSIPIASSAVMWVTLYEGSIAATLAALLISTLVTPFTTPLTLHLLLGANVQMDATRMICDMLYMVAVPALAALAFNELSHGWAARVASPVLAPAARVVLPIIILVNTTSISDYILHITPEGVVVLVFIGIFAVANFLAGIGLAKLFHLHRASFVSVVFGCGMRNISAGAVLATQYFAPAAVFPVMCGVFYQQVLAAIFGARMKHVLEKVPE